MLTTIVNRWTGAVIVSGEFDDIRSLAEHAARNGIPLADAVLTDAVLTGAVLTGAVLTRAVLTRAVLTGAVLTGAVLTRAVLTDAVLTDAVLTGAVLADAVLTGAVLTGADLTGADMDFSEWPLWCGSLKAKTDDRLNAQLLYHVISVMGTDRFTDELIDFANTFHRVGECGKLKRAGSGQVLGGIER
jgi:hypothetical protein